MTDYAYPALAAAALAAIAAGLALQASDHPDAASLVWTATSVTLLVPLVWSVGVSRGARAGIVVKGAGVIERLGRARSVLLDKTGTLTLGTPRIARVEASDGLQRGDVLRLAASPDQLSAHVLGAALVRGAHDEGIELAFPGGVREEPGQGITWSVDEHRVVLGPAATATPARSADEQGLARIAVEVDGQPVGTIVMADRIRAAAGRLVAERRARASSTSASPWGRPVPPPRRRPPTR